MTAIFVPTTAADIRDQHWLDLQVSTLGSGIEAAREIWANWSDIRCVSRFAGGLSYGDFIAARLGYALPLDAVLQIMPTASTREIAKVAGVGVMTVQDARVRNRTPDEPARVIGADGKSYPGRVIRVTTAEIIEPEEPKEARTGRNRITVTEARRLIRVVQGNLAMLQPDEVVPMARPVVRELAPALTAWLLTWSQTEEDA